MKISDKDIEKIEAIEKLFEVEIEKDIIPFGCRLILEYEALPIEVATSINNEIIKAFGTRIQRSYTTMKTSVWEIREEETRYEYVNIGKYFTEKYGNDLPSRIEKLKEETSELFEATAKPQELWDMSHVLDELADVTAVTYHIVSICGLTLEELVKQAYNKVKIREINPEYKRSKNKK